MLVLIVATGATVRLDRVRPRLRALGRAARSTHFEPKSYHSYIEFSNRVIAFFTILVTLATWLLAPRLRWLAFIVFFGRCCRRRSAH